RLHNTRHFAIPLEKKKNVGDILNKNYEDDRKLVKKNQAYDCPWDECPHSFRDPQDLRIHYMFDHESVRLFCCGERYENYDLFLEHYVTSPKETRHATWSAHECWGCQKRFIDQHDFYEHAAGCEDQINPFPCPDPLCPMKYESLMESAEHFFLWHDPAGVIHINEAVYFNLDDISPDLKIVDETQLYITHPLCCWYRCELCKTQFSSERYYQEHISQHASKPHSWLIPNILYCEQCETTSCRVQRDSIIELTNKLIDFSETATFEECEKNPLLLIWRFFLTEEYALMMKTIRALMVADNQRAEQFEIPMLDREEHPPCDDKRLANILDTLCHFLTSDVPAFSLGRKT
uniref:C2H2-type domain-containing protein n=1 Tax=Caenorhabditis japonica TaxID=281687 RepID=A0A8R1DTU8_CAEJA